MNDATSSVILFSLVGAFFNLSLIVGIILYARRRTLKLTSDSLSRGIVFE